MTNRPAPALAKLPFLIGGGALLTVAAFIALHNPHPLSLAESILCVTAVAIGAILGVTPFGLEYKTAVKFAESDRLADAVTQIQNIETLAAQISGATAQWQDVHTASAKTLAAAKEISDGMAAEVENFTEFLKKSSDAEKNALRLEVEKSRRAETEWLQVVVRILDHVFALHQAAQRSGQPELAGQIGQFQNACRDATRRIGLTPFAAEPDETFDAARHKLLDADTAPAGALVAETLAAGFTYQGRLLRPALVKLQPGEAPKSETAEAVEPTLL